MIDQPVAIRRKPRRLGADRPCEEPVVTPGRVANHQAFVRCQRKSRAVVRDGESGQIRAPARKFERERDDRCHRRNSSALPAPDADDQSSRSKRSAHEQLGARPACGRAGGRDSGCTTGVVRVSQRITKRTGALESVGRQLLKRLRQRGRHVGRDAFPERRHGLCLLRDDLHDHLLRRTTDVRRLTGQHFIEHGRQRVDVAPRRDLLFRRRLLGAHVMRRAKRQAGLRHSPAGSGRHRERDPEIHHHRAAIVQQDVLGLDVAVDHAVPVRVVERVGHLARDAHGLVHAELRFAVQLVANRLAFDEGHDVEQERVRRAGVEERQDVRMLQRCRGLDLDHEPLGSEHRGEFGLQDLDRDLAVVLQVLGEVDRGHSARTEFALDAIAVGEGRRQAGCELGHRIPAVTCPAPGSCSACDPARTPPRCTSTRRPA